MNFLNNMRISHKISVLMIGLIFGFIVIGVTYYVQINVESDARTVEQQVGTLQERLASLNLLQLNLQTTANAITSGSEEVAIEEYTQTYAKIQEVLSEIEAGEYVQDQLTRSQLDKVSEITQSLQQYDETFRAITAEASVDASPQQASPQQALADAAQRLQQSIADIGSADSGNFDIASDFNTLRNTESSFVASGQAAYRDIFARQSDQLQRALVQLPGEEAQISRLRSLLSDYRQAFNQVANEASSRADKIADLNQLGLDINRGLATALSGSNTSLQAMVEESGDQRQVIQTVVTAIIFAVAIGTAVGVYLLYKSIVFPMVHMQSVIRKINRGKTGTRVKVLTGDELGDLGKAFNKLLDERIQQLETQSQENERLNESIISLIRALGLIAQRDLTVKVPVSSDITGTVSDAVNLLTTETAKTLSEVKDISVEVNTVSDQLQEQSDLVMQVAENEKRQILATSKALEILARAMNEVAKQSESADQAATKAIESTQSARQSVVETVSGIRTIRETISETEKRTKRLGDRSQEISGIVNLINTIAERTHILALNASMHAASAGEAGKGFAVVADEVQRLAESARQSTDEIAAMVNNMRVETSDTVNIMNTLISQVAEGSRLAEQAGEQMETTETATEELVSTVKKIAEQAIQQAEVANRVRDRSALIRKFSEQTGKQLEEQKHHTDSLKQYADTLVDRVGVFTLPVIAGEKEVEASTANNVSHLHVAS